MWVYICKYLCLYTLKRNTPGTKGILRNKKCGLEFRMNSVDVI